MKFYRNKVWVWITVMAVSGAVYAPVSFAQLPGPDLITRSGFESNDGTHQIVFLTDQSVLFDEIGQSTVISAVVMDSAGQTVATELTWNLEDTTLVSLLDSNATSAKVQADGIGTETILLTATSDEFGISNAAQIVLAQLTADALYVSSALVMVNDHAGTMVILARNSETELIQPGDIILSGDKAGVLVRVLDVDLTPDQVILTVEPAKITDALENADIASSSPIETLQVLYNGAQKTLTMSKNYEILAAEVPTDGLPCKYQDGSKFDLDIVGGTIEWVISSTLAVQLRITSSVVREFSLTATQALDLTASTGSLEFSSALAGKVICELDIDPIKSPAVPLKVFSFNLSLNPSVGVEISGSINGPSFRIIGPIGDLGGSATAGILYTDTDDWEPVAGVDWSGGVSPLSANFDPNIEFNLYAGAFGALGLAIDANLGYPPFSLNLASLEFAEARGTAVLNAAFISPFNSNERGYTGPEWSADGRLTGIYKAEVSGGALNTLLTRLDIPTTVPISGNIFDPFEIDFARSPQITLDVTCNPSCPLNPLEMHSVDLQVTTADNESGTVNYFVSKDGAQVLTALTTSALSDGNSNANWEPENGEDGNYDVFPRVDTDPLSAVFPYAPAGFQSFSVGEGILIVDIPFTDSALETCVEDKAALENWVLVSEFVDAIECPNKGINNISGVEYLTESSALTVPGNPISDISPISGMTNFTYLGIQDTDVSSLAPVATLSNLLAMNASNISTSDMSPLAGFTQLNNLFLGGNNISDISFLNNLTILGNLQLQDNNIQNLTPLQNNYSLEVLNLDFNEISDTSVLWDKAALTHLYLAGNRITDVTPLLGLSGLLGLNLSSQAWPPGLNCAQQQSIVAALPTTNVQVDGFWNDPNDDPDLGDISCLSFVLVGAEVIVTETRTVDPRFDTLLASVSGLSEPVDPAVFNVNGSPLSTCPPGEVGEPKYSTFVGSEGLGEATLYPAAATSQNIVGIYETGESFNRRTCSSMIAIRNPGTSDEQVWINVAERRVSFSPSFDREYQIRYYSGDPADPDASKRCEGGWANVNFGNFNVVDNFDCDYNLLFEATPPP